MHAYMSGYWFLTFSTFEDTDDQPQVFGRGTHQVRCDGHHVTDHWQWIGLWQAATHKAVALKSKHKTILLHPKHTQNQQTGLSTHTKPIDLTQYTHTHKTIRLDSNHTQNQQMGLKTHKTNRLDSKYTQLLHYNPNTQIQCWYSLQNCSYCSGVVVITEDRLMVLVFKWGKNNNSVTVCSACLQRRETNTLGSFGRKRGW